MTARTTRPFNVLFLCTGNSARSILAEAATNHLREGKFRAYSAGSHPTGEINAFALELLREYRIPTDTLRSKSWNEFASPGSPHLDFVFTVCDKAAAEQCPYWPGQPMTAHWGVPDPAEANGTDDEKRKAFRDAFMLLKRRIDLFACLPIDKLSRLALQERLHQIGRE
jgi:arsenate reductase (thioredoxin)